MIGRLIFWKKEIKKLQFGEGHLSATVASTKLKKWVLIVCNVVGYLGELRKKKKQQQQQQQPDFCQKVKGCLNRVDGELIQLCCRLALGPN